jgi:hypothetical protein
MMDGAHLDELTAEPVDLSLDDLIELDRVCRRQGVSRPDAVHEAIRW